MIYNYGVNEEVQEEMKNYLEMNEKLLEPMELQNHPRGKSPPFPLKRVVNSHVSLSQEMITNKKSKFLPAGTGKKKKAK